MTTNSELSPDGGSNAFPASSQSSPSLDATVDKALADYQAARKLEPVLIANIKARLPDLDKLLKEIEGHWAMEDGVYRFYHQSFKVYYGLQPLTEQLVKTFQELLPQRPLNAWFLTIVKEGTGKKFAMDHNRAWLQHTRPIVEAFFHAHYFLKMICQYGRQLEAPPNPMPSGWAAVLYLYNMR